MYWRITNSLGLRKNGSLSGGLGKRWRREKSTLIDGIAYSETWKLRTQCKFGRAISICLFVYLFICSFIRCFVSIHGAHTIGWVPLWVVNNKTHLWYQTIGSTVRKMDTQMIVIQCVKV